MVEARGEKAERGENTGDIHGDIHDDIHGVFNVECSVNTSINVNVDGGVRKPCIPMATIGEILLLPALLPQLTSALPKVELEAWRECVDCVGVRTPIIWIFAV